jgi:asparagine synthase (glutamine-hydrolysing)
MGFTPFETVQPLYVDNDAPDALSRAQYADIHFYMTDDVLAKVDRMSMAHSLEVRSPLLDHRILEFAARLPAALKIDGGRGKLPLRAAAGRRLPPEIQSMPKRGFSIPAAQWLRADVRPLAEDLIFGPNACMRDRLDPQLMRTMWSEHQQGARDHSVFFWGQMMLALWHRSFG